MDCDENGNQGDRYMGLLFTIGHSKHEFEWFVQMLKKYDINYLLDVRSMPYSRYADTYNRENIDRLLTSEGIHYSFMGKYFGARPDNEALYDSDGCLNFERVRVSEQFLKGKENVKVGLEQGNNIALMCTEKDPIDCHRAIMVARAFDLDGIDVSHIMPDGSIQSQKTLDMRLLNMYFPNRAQLSLLDFETPVRDEERLIQAYRKRNRDIGYHITKE